MESAPVHVEPGQPGGAILQGSVRSLLRLSECRLQQPAAGSDFEQLQRQLLRHWDCSVHRQADFVRQRGSERQMLHTSSTGNLTPAAVGDGNTSMFILSPGTTSISRRRLDIRPAPSVRESATKQIGTGFSPLPFRQHAPSVQNHAKRENPHRTYNNLSDNGTARIGLLSHRLVDQSSKPSTLLEERKNHSDNFCDFVRRSACCRRAAGQCRGGAGP